MKEFNIFGITSKVSEYLHATEVLDELRDVETYGDESLFISKKVYRHDCGDDLTFRYQYAIQSYTSTDNGKETTYYYLYLVPVYRSLSLKKQKSVRECTCNRPSTEDVFDYGCSVIMARDVRDGGFDRSVIDDIANIVPVIDRMRGFYIDRYQNRLGSTGWDMLNDFINDVDFTKATLDRYQEEVA